MEDHGGRGSLKRKPSGRHLIENRPEAEQVGAGIHFFTARLFRRHIGDGSYRGAGTGQHRAVERRPRRNRCLLMFARQLCQTEVEHFGPAPGGNENIGGLDIAMHDSLAVRGIERVGNLNCDVKNLIVGQGSRKQSLTQRLAFQ